MAGLDRSGLRRHPRDDTLSFVRSSVFKYILGAVLGAIFIYASYDKILNPAEFARIVYHYQLIGPSPTLPPAIPNVFAIVLPWIELVAGACLLLGVWRREAAGVVAVLLILFLAAVGHALYYGIDVANCGCFTVSEGGRQLGRNLLLGDAVMLVAALYLVFAGRRPKEAS